MYPLKFKPICKEKIWGGKRLKNCFDPEKQDERIIGESLAICSSEEDQSVVVSGELKGKTIKELLKNYREEIFGNSASYWNDYFPLMIKFIDAQEKLSIQVHPDDEYALEHEKTHGKTEMWYVLDAEPGAELICGFGKNISKEVLIKAIKQNAIEGIVKKVSIKPGDILFIPAGVIHSIGEGILLAEIQENSDITYRLFDWNRLGIDSKPRELHIEKALDVINFLHPVKNPFVKGLVIEEENFTRTICVSCDKFTTEVFDVHREYKGYLNGEKCEMFISIDGNFLIEYAERKTTELLKGETLLMPASLGSFRIRGEGRFIRTYIMPPQKLLKEMIDMGISLENISCIKGLKPKA